jgi:hypothetical protein
MNGGNRMRLMESIVKSLSQLLSTDVSLSLHLSPRRPSASPVGLWSWRHPFDRMYFIDEDGHEKPTLEALAALDTIILFRSGCWAMSIVDM